MLKQSLRNLHHRHRIVQLLAILVGRNHRGTLDHVGVFEVCSQHDHVALVQDADGALLARDGVKRVEHVVEHPGQLVTRQLVDEGEQVGDVADQDRDAHVRLHVRPARVRLRPLARRWHRHDCLAVAQDSVHFEIPELSHAQLDVDARVQLLHAERLPQVVVAADGEALHDVVLGPFRAQHDDRQTVARELFAQLLTHLDPAHHRHHRVQQNQVRQIPARVDELHCFDAAHADRDLVAARDEAVLDDCVVDGVVVDAENLEDAMQFGVVFGSWLVLIFLAWMPDQRLARQKLGQMCLACR
mmetsp:Transcript_62593/g.147198  ORF Transcript_62593/g.147198 Transcript_62593/m.147198 type:complete len:300 (-) Transcript_62593:1203-2102(-)